VVPQQPASSGLFSCPEALVQVPMFESPVRRWECSHCNTKAITREPRPHAEFHPCPGYGGLTMPMVLEGSEARTRVVEREDYIAGEDVPLVLGRPVMSTITDHPDGSNDLVVYAPTAHSGTGV
jgi:hypothetical protein